MNSLSFGRAARYLWMAGALVALWGGNGFAQDFPKEEDFPRVNGSTSTVLLGELLAARATGVDAQLRRGAFFTSKSGLGQIELTLPLVYEDKDLQRFSRLAMRNAHTGTHQAYAALIGGQSDLILVARPPSDSERAEAKKAGVGFETHTIALDAFVVLANVGNPVQGLTTPQLRSIYTGQTRLWRQVGGEDLPIRALSRPRDSGSEELLDSFVLHGAKGGTFPTQNRLSEMGQMIERVAENRDAVGYSVFYFEQFMMPDARLKLLAVDGVLPSRTSIGDGSYPFVAPVLCITRTDAKPSSSAVQLRDWLLSAEGQQLVAQSGYVPATPLDPPVTPLQ